MSDSRMPGDLVERYRMLSDDIAAGIAVVSTRRGAQSHAVTVDSYLDVSYDPPTMAVSVYEGSRIYESLEASGHWCLSILSADQRDVASWLGTPGQPLFGLLNRVETLASPTSGDPIVAGSLAWFELRTVATHAIATHGLFVGQVTACGGLATPESPLIRFAGGYGSFSAQA